MARKNRFAPDGGELPNEAYEAEIAKVDANIAKESVEKIPLNFSSTAEEIAAYEESAKTVLPPMEERTVSSVTVASIEGDPSQFTHVPDGPSTVSVTLEQVQAAIEDAKKQGPPPNPRLKLPLPKFPSPPMWGDVVVTQTGSK